MEMIGISSISSYPLHVFNHCETTRHDKMHIQYLIIALRTMEDPPVKYLSLNYYIVCRAWVTLIHLKRKALVQNFNAR